MTDRKPVPGVSQQDRDIAERLSRLEQQLVAGTISRAVLKQWVRRYGDAARKLIVRYEQWGADLEDE